GGHAPADAAAVRPTRPGLARPHTRPRPPLLVARHRGPASGAATIAGGGSQSRRRQAHPRARVARGRVAHPVARAGDRARGEPRRDGAPRTAGARLLSPRPGAARPRRDGRVAPAAAIASPALT